MGPRILCLGLEITGAHMQRSRNIIYCTHNLVSALVKDHHCSWLAL